MFRKLGHTKIGMILILKCTEILKASDCKNYISACKTVGLTFFSLKVFEKSSGHLNVVSIGT